MGHPNVPYPHAEKREKGRALLRYIPISKEKVDKNVF
jgi:hypothetical protein